MVHGWEEWRWAHSYSAVVEGLGWPECFVCVLLTVGGKPEWRVKRDGGVRIDWSRLSRVDSLGYEVGGVRII